MIADPCTRAHLGLVCKADEAWARVGVEVFSAYSFETPSRPLIANLQACSERHSKLHARGDAILNTLEPAP